MFVVRCCWLIVVGGLLFVCCWLVVACVMFIVCWLLLVVCLLFVFGVCCRRFVVCGGLRCLLFVADGWWFVACRLLFGVYWLLSVVHLRLRSNILV